MLATFIQLQLFLLRPDFRSQSKTKHKIISQNDFPDPVREVMIRLTAFFGLRHPRDEGW